MSTGTAMWEISLRKQLRHGASRFELDVHFASDAQRVVLHGPSGAGKTQTLRMISGIVTPDAGRLTVAGRVLFDSDAGVSLSPQERRLAYVFQDYALFPHLTVRQNIAFAASKGWRNPSRESANERVDELDGAARASRSASRESANERVDEWIARFHLQALVDHFPHQISGGQRQRTALARALVNEPAALLLDEPFAALDRRLREQLRQELLELQTQLRLPMLLITHDDEDMAELAEQVVHLAAGRVSSDTPGSATARRPLAARVGAAPATPAPAPPSPAAPAIPG